MRVMDAIQDPDSARESLIFANFVQSSPQKVNVATDE